MARPRNTLFYETPLPDFLPPEKEWLRDYHKNSRKVLEYIVRNGAKSTAYHGAIKALTLFREHLLQNGGCFSPADASRWCTENAPLTKGYEITIKRLLDFYQYGSVQPIHAFPYVIQYCAHLNVYWLGLLEDFSLSLQDKGDKKYQDYIRNAPRDSCMACRSWVSLIFHRSHFLFWKNTVTGISTVHTTRMPDTLISLVISFI